MQLVKRYVATSSIQINSCDSLAKDEILTIYLRYFNFSFSLCVYLQEEGHRVFILQHFCDKGSLYDILDTGMLRETPSLTSPASIKKVLATALDIASALQYLHENDILHGDLSGNNVLMSTCDNSRGLVAVVSDFGLSRALSTPSHMTNSLGTVTHM